GWIGNYSHCSFQVEGTGTFLPLEGTNPFIGRPGVLERVREVRLETIVPAPKLGEAVSRMLKAHPYEEVAYDVYPLAREGRSFGLGRVGELPEAMPLAAFARQVKEALNLPGLWYSGEGGRLVRRVAVCGGSGASLAGRAQAVGADVLVTGDVKYHEAQAAELAGLAVIDAGHAGTEYPVVKALAELLQTKLTGEGVTVGAYSAPLERCFD
ncbi:MAG TPA: Nif3-like dinuclear metal center hexameric protein, partial [Firmicutes bacterium]|nr:Nif3-like dinuclear metal center hexameric protein [Bacillota bacterium]